MSTTAANFEPRSTRSWTFNIISAHVNAGIPDEIPADLIVGPLPLPTRRGHTIPPIPANLVVRPGFVPYFSTLLREWLAVPTNEAQRLAVLKREKREKERKEKIYRERKRGFGRQAAVKKWKHGGRKGKGIDNGDGGRFRVKKGMVVLGKKPGQLCKREEYDAARGWEY